MCKGNRNDDPLTRRIKNFLQLNVTVFLYKFTEIRTLIEVLI